jgi:hypothetical protein
VNPTMLFPEPRMMCLRPEPVGQFTEPADALSLRVVADVTVIAWPSNTLVPWTPTY